ncbi:phosphohydrolase [Propionigenium maris DSM 9537]|uniref:Phosphohydrolase n=1 Tax=Propionigenium maris DSM 9537 TaxID=1123000 RepID=A0A9W6LN23_9FUSO|nr:HD domain-containing protein [Propionigenium maris]GLI55460.1 phosphohydrolase [Propionigenium maris DSM 9537]
MKDREVIERVENYLREKFLDRGDAHDYWHMMRVYKLAREICMAEEGDLQIVSLAALLHDVADHKFLEPGDTEEGKLAEVLDELEILGETRERIEEIILNLSYKGGTNRYEFDHLEGKIVRDADRLDSIGAIGVGRAFAYGGSRDRPMHDPLDKPKEFKDLQEYKKNNGSTINHFYEKLLKLRDGFYTETARKRAVRRHEFMEEFLREFLLEWEGKA